MNHRLVFDSEEKIRCQLFAVVVRNTALERRYSGGLRGFIDAYPALCNMKITVLEGMGWNFEEVIADLRFHELIPERDFVFIDIIEHEWRLLSRPEPLSEPHEMRLPVDWLKARYMNGAVYVWAVPGHSDQKGKAPGPSRDRFGRLDRLRVK